MNKSIAKSTAIIREFCKTLPSMPSRTLARVILTEHPELGKTGDKDKDIDNIRSAVRHARGKHGNISRRKNNVIESDTLGYIPPALHKRKTPYEMKQTGQILFVGDIHAPYHEKEPIRLMLDYCVINYDIKAVCFVGDTMDCPAVSKFSKGLGAPSVQDEIPYVEDILDTFEDALGGAKFIWKDGNHEMRLPRYINNNAPELADLIKVGAGDLIKVRERGYDYVGPLQLIHSGKLTVVHGNEVGINSVGVNPARSLFLKTKETCLCFHLHNTSSHTEKTLRGKLPTCWSAGCMCDLHPDYSPHGNKFNWGFAVQDLHKSGQFELENMRILNGKVVRG